MVSAPGKSVPKPAMPAAPSRVIVQAISPLVEQGRFPAKTVVGRPLRVEAVVICDGHEMLKADLLYRRVEDAAWQRLPMTLRYNDTYFADLPCEDQRGWVYTVEAAIDRFGGWRDAFLKKLKAGEAGEADMQTGLAFMAGKAAAGFQDRWRDADHAAACVNDAALRDRTRGDWADPSTVRFPVEARVQVDPVRAGFSSWYEFFPRSRWDGVAPDGTLKDAAARLEYAAGLGFDIVYFPPIHPIGAAFRKGRNNAVKAEPGDTGSPWAIGGKTGGHKAIDPALGTFADFDALVKKARGLGIDLALDIAFQCSPDHPYVNEHPEWFKKRADGSIQYAENPPKKYQDIYPFDFECAAWQELWAELLSVLTFWIGKGVRVFRVDNPHTKAFAFWEWAIGEVRKAHPEVIFLAEAFAKPHVMAWLAKIGFDQSYTYFAWRQSKKELIDYAMQLTQSEWKDYFRPNFWPNTPDILTAELQAGSRAVYVRRLVLAATLSSNYGIYGPPFELMDSAPAMAGKEEYLDSEKYQTRDWDVRQPGSLAPLIARVNKARRDNKALQSNDRLMFHPVDNDQLLAYTKGPDADGTVILVVVNLDATAFQSGIIDLQIQKLGIDHKGTYEAHELLSDARYEWRGWRNYVGLDPNVIPAQVFKLKATGPIQE